MIHAVRQLVRYAAVKRALGKAPDWLTHSLSALLTKPGAEAAAAMQEIEALRTALSNREGGVPIYYSPKPGAYNADSGRRPEHGEIKTFTFAQVARTGVDQRWGTALFELTRSLKPGVIVELGSCAGFSACYMAAGSPPSKLITVEASPNLARIAQFHLDALFEGGEVWNMLFDDALNRLIDDPGNVIDLAFIDGHHEREATIHYFERIQAILSPGAIVLFDDIRWSHDMYDLWRHIRQMPCVEIAADLGKIGLIAYDPAPESSTYFDFSFAGSRSIGTPHGWGS